MTRPGTIDSGARGGFALPVVLVTLAILTMIFLTIVLAIDDSATQILSRQHQAEFELRALSAEAEFCGLGVSAEADFADMVSEQRLKFADLVSA